MNETMTAEAGVRTFRGESIEALLPQIRAELGADAVILRQREGLVGGVGGFFQKRCVEVEARSGGPGIDAYDEEVFDSEGPDQPRVLSQGEGGAAGEGVLDPPPPVPPTADPGSWVEEALVRNDVATREGLESPVVQEMVAQAEPFAEMLGEVAGTGAAVEVEAASADGARPIPRRAEALRDGMVASGLGEDIAGEIVEAVVSGVMPFATPARLRTLVRNELALRLPVAPAVVPGARTVAMVGPAGAGKSAAIAAIAAAYEQARMPVAIHQLGEKDGGTGMPGGLTLIDTPALWSGAEELRKVGRKLSRLSPDEVHLVMRAGTAAGACAELAEGLAALKPSRILLTGAAETGHLGGVLDAAIRTGIPLSYVAESAAEIAPADPRTLAERIVP